MAPLRFASAPVLTSLAVLLLLQEFILLAKRLLDDRLLQKQLSENGMRYVGERHSFAQERKTYQQLVETLHL